MMDLPITGLYAGLLALLILFLLFKVVGFRRGKQVLLGDGGDSHGLRLVRGHANATETIPIFLIMLALIEGMGSPGWVVHLLGAPFLLGRVLHAYHFVAARRDLSCRMAGMILTLLPTGFAALGLVAHSLVRL